MNFEFHNPTKLVFGPEKRTRLGEVVSEYGEKGKRPNNPILHRPADMLRSPQKQGGLYARQFHSIWPSPKQG
jgi:hypothetical protein